MSTNPNTKTYWRRISRMARKLAFGLSCPYGKSVAGIIADVDPQATRTMRREAIKMAIQDCSESEGLHTREIERHRVARARLQAFRDPVSLRVVDGGKTQTKRSTT